MTRRSTAGAELTGEGMKMRNEKLAEDAEINVGRTAADGSCKRRILLKAIEHNWDLIGPEDWNKVEWNIFSDGSYRIITAFNPMITENDEILEMQKRGERPKPIKKQTSGRMDEKAFSKLREAIKMAPWRDPTVYADACDGVAWEIKSYRSDGSIENTSGKLDYIYGHCALETIVSLLPTDGKVYDSSAYISVKKRNVNA